MLAKIIGFSLETPAFPRLPSLEPISRSVRTTPPLAFYIHALLVHSAHSLLQEENTPVLNVHALFHGSMRRTPALTAAAVQSTPPQTRSEAAAPNAVSSVASEPARGTQSSITRTTDRPPPVNDN